MSKKKIAIPAWATGENSFGITKPYFEFFSQFGQVEILSQRSDIIDCDLLVLPGGADVNPIRYGAVPSCYTGNANPFLEYFDVVNLHQYIKKGVSVFGICRGFQTLNVHFGGSLLQHGYYPYTERHERKELLVFELSKEDSELLRFPHQYKVNSLHHQSVTVNSLASDLVSLAKSAEHKNIEAFRHKTLPIYGVEWHPEEIYDEFCVNIINKLLNS